MVYSAGPSSGCGGEETIGSNPIMIQSPDVNGVGRYDDLLDCHWLVQAADSHYIIINVVSIDVTDCNTTSINNSSRSSDCMCDYVEVILQMIDLSSILVSLF